MSNQENPPKTQPDTPRRPTVNTCPPDKLAHEPTVVGEATERFLLAAKETSENLTDVGVLNTIAETKNGGRIPTRTIDNGRGTVPEDPLPVPA